MDPGGRTSRHFQRRDQERDDRHIFDEIRMRADRATQPEILAIAERDAISPPQPHDPEREGGIDQGKQAEIEAGDGWRLHAVLPDSKRVPDAVRHSSCRSAEPGPY